MSEESSVTGWLSLVKQGDQDGMEKIYQRYFPQLVRLVGTKMWGNAQRVADGEDMALSAMDSFFRGAADGKFLDLADREELWNLLRTITFRKVCDWLQYLNRDRRIPPDRIQSPEELHQVTDPQLTPEMEVEIIDEVERLFRLLDEDHRAAVRLRMEGYTDQQIADRLDVSLRTVQRMLNFVRKVWKRET